MPSFAVITVRARPGVAERFVEQAFEENGFSLQWSDPWRGTAIKTIRTKGFLGWDSKRNLTVEFSISPQKEVCILRVHTPKAKLLAADTVAAGALLGAGGLGFAIGYKISSDDPSFTGSINALIEWLRDRGVLEDAVQRKHLG